MNKKKIILIFLAAIAILTGIIVTYIFFKNKNNGFVTSSKEGDVTRYEWIEMLCEETGMTQYENQTPYFQDVSKDDSHFASIQSAVEWELLDGASDFCGDELASGNFIALTAMKTIGKYKVQLYLDTEDTVSDDVYTGLAIELGLIENEDLLRGFSKEECENVLDKLREVYFGELWKDDMESVSYRENVLELTREDILQGNEDYSEIKVADSVLSEVSEGTVIVFEYGETGLKAAKKVIGIEGDGRLLLSDDVELDEILDSLVVSDITEVTVENILNYYGLKGGIDSVDSRADIEENRKFIPMAFSSKKESKGFKISVETEEEDGKNVVSIMVTNNDSGISYKLPIEKEVGEDCKYQAEVDVDKIIVATQIDYDRDTGLEYAEVALDTHTTFSGGIAAEDSEKILLCEAPIPLVTGIVDIKIQLYLVISIEGSITLEAELPMAACVRYEKGKGIRNYKPDIPVKEPELKVNCEASLMLRGEFTLEIFFTIFIVDIVDVDIVDVEADIGIVVSAEMIERPILTCIDASAAFPVISVSVCGDEDADTFVGGVLGLSGEWEIISSEDAPIRFGLHYEKLPDGSGQFVDECTYDGNQEEASDDTEQHDAHQEQNDTYEEQNDTYEEQEDIVLDNTYITEYGDIKFAFDYTDDWGVTFAESDDIFKENVVLRNDRNLAITYWEFNVFPLGGGGHASMWTWKVEMVADSSIEGFMVGKMQIVGETDMLTGDEYDIEDGAISYAVMPGEYIGTHGAMVGLAGLYEECSFPYNSSRYMMLVESPDGKFTKEEEREVIAILSSFRLINADNSNME